MYTYIYIYMNGAVDIGVGSARRARALRLLRRQRLRDLPKSAPPFPIPGHSWRDKVTAGTTEISFASPSPNTFILFPTYLLGH